MSDIAWFNPETNDLDIWMLRNGHWSASADLGAHPAGWRPAGIGDFNGDGTSDILWTNASSGTAEIWQVADGHWAASVDLGARPEGSGSAIGDFDHNGVSDIKWHNNATGAVASWLFDAQHQLTAQNFMFV